MYLFQQCRTLWVRHQQWHLHSTMYLFQLRLRISGIYLLQNLHSTMYLFQLFDDGTMYISLSFTFHYVSISTLNFSFQNSRRHPFTFHYVSISTLWTIHPDAHGLSIYIPLCIYFNRSCKPILRPRRWYLHSTMYLFQPVSFVYLYFLALYLHSTMYLFQLHEKNKTQQVVQYLHSTMYLFQLL